MEYSMYVFEDTTTTLTTDTGYDHYRVDIGTMDNFTTSFDEPFYWDYSSPITKTLLISNDFLLHYLLSDKFQAPLLANDWTTHYQDIFGHLHEHYISIINSLKTTATTAATPASPPRTTPEGWVLLR